MNRLLKVVFDMLLNTKNTIKFFRKYVCIVQYKLTKNLIAFRTSITNEYRSSIISPGAAKSILTNCSLRVDSESRW